MTGKIIALGFVIFTCGSVFTESLIDGGFTARTPDGGAVDLLVAILILWMVHRVDKKRASGRKS